MPKVSKVKIASSRPGAAPPVKEKPDKYMCTRCGKLFTRQHQNFPTSQSPLYKENNGYLTVCSTCADDLLEHYKSVLGSEPAAIRRLCMKFDIYWHPEIYAMIYKGNTNRSRIRTYISKTNLYKYIGKTYDDTIDEETIGDGPVVLVDDDAPDVEFQGANAQGGYVLTTDTIAFWGAGFTEDVYQELEVRYARWTNDVPQPIDTAAEVLYRNICILETTISRNAAAGKPIEQSVNALNNLLGSANLKPVQKKQDEVLDASFESMPFGVGIKMCENSRPIPKPIPELEDVDGVVRYISIWFLGHLCKMLGIRNTYCKLYEDEMARLKVERLENEDEDDEGAFNDIFGDSAGDIGGDLP